MFAGDNPQLGAPAEVRAGEVVVLMTGAAFLRSDTVAVRTAAHVHGVRMPVIALPRKISLRVTVHAIADAAIRERRREKRTIAGGCGRHRLRIWRSAAATDSANHSAPAMD